MELQGEVERIGPQNALVTNHFTGEVRLCNTRGHGHWGCREIEIEPRSWVLTLVPLWPARNDLGAKLYLSKTWTDESPFAKSQFLGLDKQQHDGGHKITSAARVR